MKANIRSSSESQRGQTLLELVIAIAVMAVIITGLVVAGVSSLRFGQESRTRSTAVKYAQEGLELAREIRDTSTWDTFLAYSGGGVLTWCLSSLAVWTQDNGSGCGPIASGSPYSRSVEFTWNDPVMKVVSTVTWNVGSSQLSTQLQTYLTQWK